MNSKSLAMLLSLTILLSLLIPFSSGSGVTPLGVTPPTRVFQQFGPNLDAIHYVYTGEPEASFMALDVGEIDICDWPLSKEQKEEWEDPATTDINVTSYGGEYSYFILGVRESPTKPVNPPYSTQTYVATGDPIPVTISISSEETYWCTRGAAMRRALAHTINRTHLTNDVLGGLANPIHTPVPMAQNEYVNPNVEKYFTDFDKAREILDDAGIIDSDGEGWRDIPGTTEELILDFGIRDISALYDFGIATKWAIETELQIHVNDQVMDYWSAHDHIMEAKEMDLYTRYWHVGPIHDSPWFSPNHLPWLYSSMGYWHPSSPPNYMMYCGPYSETVHYDPNIEAAAEAILSSPTATTVKATVWDMQEIMQRKENVYTIPLCSLDATKAFRICKVDTTLDNIPVPNQTWERNPGMVDEKGFGVNSWWTFLNAFTSANPNSGLITYGISYPGVQRFNPIYSSAYPDWEHMNKIYDPLVIVHPYKNTIPYPLTKPRGRGWVAYNWRSMMLFDNGQGKQVSVLRFKIRNDVYWHDHTTALPRQLTADDVIFTLTGLWNINGTGLLQVGGHPNPCWISNIAHIHRIDKLSRFEIRVWMNVRTYWALTWVGRNIILPEHVWRPYLEGAGDPEVFAPDPKLIGSGPFHVYPFDYDDPPPGPAYTEFVGMTIYAYKPGSIPGNPENYFRFPPIVVGDPPKTLVGDRYEGHERDFSIIMNYALYPITVDYTVSDETGPFGTVVGATVPAASDDGETPGMIEVVSPYPLPDSPIDTIFNVEFTHVVTWEPLPPPGFYTITFSHQIRITIAGDITEPVGAVDVSDAIMLTRNWGSTGPWNYPNADITDWGLSENKVDIYDAIILSTNYEY